MVKKIFDAQNELPIPGKYYWVMCAVLRRDNNKELRYIPIIGIDHADPQFGVTYRHFHVDGRFSNSWTDKKGCQIP